MNKLISFFQLHFNKTLILPTCRINKRINFGLDPRNLEFIPNLTVHFIVVCVGVLRDVEIVGVVP